MAEPSLKDPLLELVRAEEHLNSLDAERIMFHTSNPTEVSIQVNPTGHGKIIYVKLPLAPARIGLIAGDAIFALRAALDHLMWQMCLFTTDNPNPRTEFPCAWKLDSRTGKRGTEARLREATKEIPTACAEKVKALQPYHRGNAYKDDPLWKIDQLCNVAKHMMIPISHVVVGFETNVDEKGIEQILRPRLDEMIYVLTEDASLNVQLRATATSQIVFGSKQLGVEVTTSEIRGLHKYVAESVFPRFRPCFESSADP